MLRRNRFRIGMVDACFWLPNLLVRRVPPHADLLSDLSGSFRSNLYSERKSVKKEDAVDSDLFMCFFNLARDETESEQQQTIQRHCYLETDQNATSIINGIIVRRS